MARLLTVINERKKICEEYRKSLEDEYVNKQRKTYDEKLAELQKKKDAEPEVPEITRKLIHAKYRDLKRGVDNVEYIKEALLIEKNKNELKQTLKEKYDYKKKKIAKIDEKIDENQKDQVIQQFKSGIHQQINEQNYKISQEEVLRSHIKNWKMLNLKQRRIVLGYLNARRAKDAKSEFLKELNLLGQKIAYENSQKRIKEEQKA